MFKLRMFPALALLGFATAVAAVAAPEDADEAVRKVLRGLEEKQPQVLWQALPASYQADVHDLIHEAASNADAQVWNGAFRVLGKLVRVLDEKRGFILQNPMVASKLSETEGSDGVYDAVVTLLGILTTSELSDADRLRQIDMGKFMAGTVRQMMLQLEVIGRLSPESAEEVEKFQKSKVALVSQDGDSAVVRIEGGDKVEETKMARVEGKWIPADMAEGWKEKVEEMRAQMSQLPGRKDSEDNSEILLTMGQVESSLDTLLEAETAEEFEGAAQAFVGMMMFRFAGAMGGEAEEEEDPGNR